MRGWRPSGVGALEDDGARGGAAAGRHDGGLRVGDLAVAGVVAELRDRFVEEAHAVRAALGQLAAVRVERERRRRGRCVRPPSIQSFASPKPQKPSASIHVMQLNVKPSYSRATSTSAGVSDVRVQRCVDWPITCGSWVTVSWSHERRSVICVPDGLDADRRVRQVAGDVGRR